MSSYQLRYEQEPGDFSNQCRGKHRHTSKRQANGARRVLMKVTPSMVNAYKCRNCKGWHIGRSAW